MCLGKRKGRNNIVRQREVVNKNMNRGRELMISKVQNRLSWCGIEGVMMSS